MSYDGLKEKDKIITLGPMEYFTSAAETGSFLNFSVSSLDVTSSSLYRALLA